MEQTISNVEVLSSDNINGFNNALEDAITVLEERGLGDIQDKTPIHILISKNGKIINGDFGVDAKIFIGGSLSDVATSIQSQLK